MKFATGTTDVSLTVMLVDDSGLPVAGLLAATFPSVYLARPTGADIGPVTLSDLASLAAAHTDGGVFERGDGRYRLDVPDSLCAVAGIGISIRAEATGKRLIVGPIDVGVLQTGDTFARVGVNGAGLTNLPWPAAWNAEVQSECEDALAAYDPPTNAEMVARTLAAASYATSAVCTEARLAELDNANLPTDVANVKTDTAAILDDTGTSGVVVAAGSKTGYSLANSSIAAATFAAGAITSTVIAANAIGDSQLAGDVATGVFVNGGTIAESYAADGAVGTPAQLLYELLQNITEFVISGTTKTVKKRDGSATAATYTHDDALNPTSITRAT